MVRGWWQTLSNATRRKITDLVIIVANSQTTVLLNSQTLTRWQKPSEKPNPLSEVTDPEFLLVETEV